MSELPMVPGQAFPGVGAFVDLRPYMDSSWEGAGGADAGSAWHCRALLSHNLGHLHVRTRLGTSMDLIPANVLPPEVRPAGQEVLTAWTQSRGDVRMFFETNGRLHFDDAAADVANGREWTVLIRHEYLRRAA
ncbi:hypothetical protein [Nesterenkonia flava]|uniref:Uncharacterized protein n=1 Tax=Nesterenkonia flava TaxID=469799 RepID=A0ABU1FRW4_9MICC|nr:hypothetical protein [Nesterenkonia flava]MDR5711390.1 hypothetical protein [Nesterenkonia flava]